MTRAHYYASTTNVIGKNIADYLIAPVIRLGTALCTDSPNKAAGWASALTAGFYAYLTSDYFGREATMLDMNAREAVSAELGIPEDKLQFSDYWKSKNILVQKELQDLTKLNKWRYATDALFLLPLAGLWAQHSIPGFRRWLGKHEVKIKDAIDRHPHGLFKSGIGASIGDLLGVVGFSGKALYWQYETFEVKKTGHYEVVKLRETKESTGKMVDADDLLAILQRTREDQGMSKLNAKERSYIRPLLKQLADLSNETDSFGIGEIVYLIGMDKIRIHGPDGVTVSQEAIEQSKREIERVGKLGMNAIREENRQQREALIASGQLREEEPGFVARLQNDALNGALGFYQHLFGVADETTGFQPENGKKPQLKENSRFRFEEHISPRDAAEFIYGGTTR